MQVVLSYNSRGVYMGNSSRLADSTANQILKMIEEEERFSVGDKLPNENDFAARDFPKYCK